MELLSVGVVNNYFTCKQTARLMSIFTWDDEKMKVLRMVSNRIVDRENGKEISTHRIQKTKEASEFLENLPFSLTVSG